MRPGQVPLGTYHHDSGQAVQAGQRVLFPLQQQIGGAQGVGVVCPIAGQQLRRLPGTKLFLYLFHRTADQLRPREQGDCFRAFRGRDIVRRQETRAERVCAQNGRRARRNRLEPGVDLQAPIHIVPKSGLEPLPEAFGGILIHQLQQGAELLAVCPLPTI